MMKVDCLRFMIMRSEWIECKLVCNLRISKIWRKKKTLPWKFQGVAEILRSPFLNSHLKLQANKNPTTKNCKVMWKRFLWSQPHKETHKKAPIENVNKKISFNLFFYDLYFRLLFCEEKKYHSVSIYYIYTNNSLVKLDNTKENTWHNPIKNLLNAAFVCLFIRFHWIDTGWRGSVDINWLDKKQNRFDVGFFDNVTEI